MRLCSGSWEITPPHPAESQEKAEISQTGLLIPRIPSRLRKPKIRKWHEDRPTGPDVDFGICWGKATGHMATSFKMPWYRCCTRTCGTCPHSGSQTFNFPGCNSYKTLWSLYLAGFFPLPGFLPFSNVIRNCKLTHRQNDAWTRLFIKALFAIAEYGRHPKHPSIED